MNSINKLATDILALKQRATRLTVEGVDETERLEAWRVGIHLLRALQAIGRVPNPDEVIVVMNSEAERLAAAIKRLQIQPETSSIPSNSCVSGTNSEKPPCQNFEAGIPPAATHDGADGDMEGG